jgi:hypothetical protein
MLHLDWQWLPIGAGSYKEFQYYLMKLWLPSTCSFLLYITFFKSMVNISLAEVTSAQNPEPGTQNSEPSTRNVFTWVPTKKIRHLETLYKDF